MEFLKDLIKIVFYKTLHRIMIVLLKLLKNALF